MQIQAVVEVANLSQKLKVSLSRIQKRFFAEEGLPELAWLCRKLYKTSREADYHIGEGLFSAISVDSEVHQPTEEAFPRHLTWNELSRSKGERTELDSILLQQCITTREAMKRRTTTSILGREECILGVHERGKWIHKQGPTKISKCCLMIKNLQATDKKELRDVASLLGDDLWAQPKLD